MCRKYQVRGEDLSLKQVLDRIQSKPHLPPKVVYSTQEVLSAAKVLERLTARTICPARTI